MQVCIFAYIQQILPWAAIVEISGDWQDVYYITSLNLCGVTLEQDVELNEFLMFMANISRPELRNHNPRWKRSSSLPVHMCSRSRGQHNKPEGLSYPICLPGNAFYSHSGNDKNKPECSPCRSTPLCSPHTHSTTASHMHSTLPSCFSLRSRFIVETRATHQPHYSRGSFTAPVQFLYIPSNYRSWLCLEW